MKETRTVKRRDMVSKGFLAVLCILLGINLYLLNAQTLGGTSLPMPFGYGIAVVLSGSMEPALSTDDLVIIKKTEDYDVGDIVVYQDKTALIVHRIIERKDTSLYTKGDANNQADEPISVTAVQGEVIASIPFAGKAVSALKSPGGILGILAAAWLLMEFPFRRKKKKDREEQEKIRKEIEKLKQELK